MSSQTDSPLLESRASEGAFAEGEAGDRGHRSPHHSQMTELEADPNSVEALCSRHYRAAEAYARRLWQQNRSLRDRLDLLDAESAAGYGLLRAAKSWDAEKGEFEPWMRRHVRYEVWEEARQATLVSRSAMKKLKELREAEMALEKAGHQPTVSAIAEEMAESVDHVSALQELRNIAREPSDLEVAEAMAMAEEATKAEERVAEAMSAFGPLSGDERVVLALHYLEGVSFRDVARLLNKRPDAVSRIHTRAKDVAAAYLESLGEAV